MKADIYVNSTNTDMDLSNGKLGSVLLKACGKELQDECKQYAPLQPGSVAVTGAKNVKCKKIFHVALPDYRRSANPERVRMCFKSDTGNFVGVLVLRTLHGVVWLCS